MTIRLRLIRWVAAVIVLLGGPSALTLAQPVPDTSTVESDLEEVFDDLDPDATTSVQLAERLTALAAHPLNANVASSSDLRQIPFLPPALATRIVTYRSEHGAFASLNDLLKVPGMTPQVLQRLRPYLHVVVPSADQPGRWSRFRTLDYEIIQRVTRRLDLGPEYDSRRSSSPFLGSPERLYTRIRVRNQRGLRLGLTLDKDPGEPFQWHPQTQTYGFDHWTGHVALIDRGPVESLIAGDFTAEFGQGLTLWRSMAFGKGRDPVTPLVRSGPGFVPYGSTEENRFFRGLATTLRLHPSVSLSAMASRRSLDATLTPPPESSQAGAAPLVISEPESGLHRTAAEQARKDALHESVVGGAVEYRRTAVQVGLVGYRSALSAARRPGLRPDERFDWTGATATMVSAYANASIGAYHVFGEAGRAPSGAWGSVGGVAIDFAPQMEALLLARYYPRDFQSRHGYAFGERNGATQNELGLYAGLRFRLSPQWRVSASFDQYRFPWLRFATPRPTSGYDVRVVIDHTPRRWLHHYVQFRTETREAAAVASTSPVQLLKAVRPETRQSLRWHGRYVFSDQLRLQSRIELSRFKVPTVAVHTGSMVYQDVRWRPVPALRLDGRVAFFDTDGFAARIYAYENDLLYAFAIPVLSGRGQRRYLMADLDVGGGLDLQLKYSVTRFADERERGRSASRLREIRLQLRWAP